MGFDLMGLNPQADTPRPEWTKNDPEYEIDPQLKEEYDDYMRERLEWQDANEGAYFRNNVWFWRPLWFYVCSVCYDILSANDIQGGSYNDGYKISKTKSKKIARKLRKMFREGHVELTEARYRQHQEQLPDDDSDKSYPFSTENVRKFERFCEKSGGFEIC